MENPSDPIENPDDETQDPADQIDENTQPGLSHSTLNRLPDGEPTCCEHEWTVRFLTYHPASVVPRRMYFSSCNTNTAKPLMFTLLSPGENRKHPEPDPSSGAIIRREMDPRTGKLTPKEMRRFPECIWMEGIATVGDCQTIGVLCRRKFEDKDYDFDSLSTHEDADWMTEKRCAKHSMWLYEWKNGDIRTEPKKYVVHRALDFDWEYGNNYLRLAEDQNVYGIGAKARGYGGGTCHEADPFTVLDRKNYKFTDRGYSWACGTGYTLFNRPTYNKTTGKFALMCGTDGSKAGAPLGGFWFRREDQKSREFYHTSYEGIRIKGGPGAKLPMADGGAIWACWSVYRGK